MCLSSTLTGVNDRLTIPKNGTRVVLLLMADKYFLKSEKCFDFFKVVKTRTRLSR